MPISVVCDSCHSKYSLKDEFAGRKVKCKSCGEVLFIPGADDFPELRPDRGYHEAFDRDRFYLNQKHLAIDEKYLVFGDEDDNQDNDEKDREDRPILYIVRPRLFLKRIGGLFAAIVAFFVVTVPLVLVGGLLGQGNQPLTFILMSLGLLLGIAATIATGVWATPKRHIFFYADEDKEELLMEVLQDQKVSFIRATYTVRDAVEGELGRMKKNYLYNLFRKRWDVSASDGSTLAVAREDSLILSLLRRFLGPMLGLLRTNFIILRPGSEEIIGEFNRKMTFADRYVLDMRPDRDHILDRRMAIALGVLLDTGESR